MERKLELFCSAIETDRVSRPGGQNERNNKTIETQHFGKDKDQDHADVETRLLRSASDTGVSHNANGEAGRQARQTNTQTCAQMMEAPFF
ncbi:ribose-5-phosphate isomerase [Brachionus plicatilis]|uniref:Ribose-5-phosphate isomerase n=1 Tax=Brachionus plicatilis TaxID=10195 RepID=A0A3M7T1U0_BRAPC|nr:ribose-5-phosphate isomerase [Brachionus plicatilis]